MAKNNNNNNKLFGGLGPEKAGELGGSAHHVCRGKQCDNEAHKNKDQHKSATHKSNDHKANAGHKK